MTSRTNVTLSETTTYTWNEDNRLTQVQLPGGATVSYTYDTLGRMLTRTDSSGTTTFVWADDMNCVQETDYLGNVTRYYHPSGMLMSFDRTVSGSTTTYQVHSDAHGSARKVTAPNASVVATYDYDAWGNQLASTSDSIPNGGLQYRFIGALGVRWDAGTGLCYMRQRWYDPQLARFLSRDIKGSVNRYSYANCNPCKYADPSGLTYVLLNTPTTQPGATSTMTITSTGNFQGSTPIGDANSNLSAGSDYAIDPSGAYYTPPQYVSFDKGPQLGGVTQIQTSPGYYSIPIYRGCGSGKTLAGYITNNQSFTGSGIVVSFDQMMAIMQNVQTPAQLQVSVGAVPEAPPTDSTAPWTGGASTLNNALNPPPSPTLNFGLAGTAFYGSAYNFNYPGYPNNGYAPGGITASYISPSANISTNIITIQP